jgi:dipeptidyl aminopeptidase/acylaminoacyl peptidase
VDKGAEPVQRTSDPKFEETFPQWSPDGNTIATRLENPLFGSFDIWLLDLSRGTRSRLTSEPALTGGHIWSPDGTRIVYSSARNGTWDLYQKATNGKAPEELLFRSEDNKFVTDWSPDGRFITYHSVSPQEEGGSTLWVLPMFGDRQPTRFIGSKVNAASGRFSPNGRWLSYNSDESGRLEWHVRPFPSSDGVWPFLPGRSHRWRRDGKELFYIGLDGKLMAAKASTDKTFQLDSPKPLFEVRTSSQYGGGTYAVTADGQRFLFAVPPTDAPSPSIRVVVNWPALLKRKPSP